MRKEKFYEAHRELILNAVCDMAEIQHGRNVFSNIESSCTGYSFKAGDREYKYSFIVKNFDSGCTVTLEAPDMVDESMMDRAFFLLESLLCGFHRTVGHIESGVSK